MIQMKLKVATSVTVAMMSSFETLQLSGSST